MANLVSWLFVKELVNLLILNLVEDSLKKLLQRVVVHDSLSHGNESDLGRLPHVLGGILQVLGQLH